MRLSISQKLSLAPLAVALFFALLCFGYLLPAVNQAIELHTLAGSEQSAMRAQVQVITTRFSVMILVALVAISIVGFVVGRRLVAPLRQLTDAANRIAEGDLHQKVEVDTDDEVGQLARAFSSMASRLKDVLHQVQEFSKLLGTSVAGLNTSADEQGQMVSRQAAALQETQVTAQEIRQTSLLAAKTADSVLQVAERADSLGRSGEESINASIHGLETLREHVMQITERIIALSTRTEQISGITETVKNLAEQSNLLAVNAAIEAARSGEQGKGFAVVAREIRALADQSMRATNQVREILVDISSAISTTVSITAEGAERMEEGLRQVRTSGNSLRELSTIVQDNAAAVRQIAHAVGQQNTGIEQIFAAVNDLNQLMTQTVERISHTAESAQSLKAMSEEVEVMMRHYHV